MVLRRILIFTIMLVMGVEVFAQQDAQFTQNMFNRLFYNPAYAGSNGSVCGTALYREQYTGFEGTPATAVVSVEGAFNLPALYMNQSGLGLTIMQDEIGYFKTFAAKLAYSHLIKPKFMPGFLRIGIEGGIVNNSLNGDWIATDNVDWDPAILNGTDLTGDFGFGLYYYTKSLYVGLSSPHLTEPTLTTSEGNKSQHLDLDRHYYGTVGYYYDFNTPTPMQLQPSVLFKSSLAATQVDINVNFLYNKFIWAGVSGRPEDNSVVLAGLFGVDLYQVTLQNFKVGFAYDFGLSEISKETGGSFEIMANYCYKIIVPPKRQKYKSVIWL